MPKIIGQRLVTDEILQKLKPEEIIELLERDELRLIPPDVSPAVEFRVPKKTNDNGRNNEVSENVILYDDDDFTCDGDGDGDDDGYEIEKRYCGPELRVLETDDGEKVVNTHYMQVKKISGRHRIVMYMLAAGKKQREICETLGYNRQRLSIIVNSPLFRAEYKKIENQVCKRVVDKISDIDDRILTLKPKALDVLEGLMTSDSPKVPLRLRRDCAKDILDLAAGRQKRDNEGMNDFARFCATAFSAAIAKRTMDENEDLKKENRALRAIDDANPVIDADVGDTDDVGDGVGDDG